MGSLRLRDQVQQKPCNRIQYRLTVYPVFRREDRVGVNLTVTLEYLPLALFEEQEAKLWNCLFQFGS